MQKRPETSHLTEEQIEELYRRYIAGERNTDLIAEYKISVNPNSLIKVLPPIRLESTLCPYCNVSMYERRWRKSNSSAADADIFCGQCSHKHITAKSWGRSQYCTCKPCLSQRAEESAKKEQALREIIRAYWLPKIGEATEYERLDTEEKIYLLSLINAQADFNRLIVESVSERNHEIRLAPSDTQQREILELLHRRKLIAIDPESPTSAFKADEISSHNQDGVRWIINVKLKNDLRSSAEFIQRQITKEFSLAAGIDIYQVKELALRVLTEKVIQRLHYQCSRVFLPFIAEKKGREVAKSLLLNHSLAQVCYFGYLATRQADDYYRNSDASSVKASNIIPKKMLEYGLKATNEAWESKSKYFTNDPRSEISKVIFDLILKAEDGGSSKKVGTYFSSVPPGDTPKAAALLYCQSCGSKAVHTSARERNLFIDCKDCMARFQVSLAQLTGQA